MKEKWDVAIIGGGPAGLATAATVAQGGKSVVLLEKGQEFGGRAISTTEAGAILNLGPHALYRNGAAHRVLDRLGSMPNGGKPSQNITWVFSPDEAATTAGLLI